MARITSIEGNRQLLDGGAMFGNAPRAVWEKWIAPDELGRIPLACRCLLIEDQDLKILCETGIGAFFEPKMAARFGVQEPGRHLLLEHLAERNIQPGDLDYVILSHLHFDHAGGLLSVHRPDRALELVFPNAKFIVGREAWARALAPHPRDRASFIPELTKLLEDSGRLILIGRDALPEKLASRLEFIPSDGHTPGQLHTLYRGDAGRVFFCGDLVPGRAWVHLSITMGYDRFPEKVIDEKTALYPRALREHWLMFFTHDPTAAASHLKFDGGKYVPVDVKAELTREPL